MTAHFEFPKDPAIENIELVSAEVILESKLSGASVYTERLEVINDEIVGTDTPPPSVFYGFKNRTKLKKAMEILTQRNADLAISIEDEGEAIVCTVSKHQQQAQAA